jgi:hypothetical protein
MPLNDTFGSVTDGSCADFLAPVDEKQFFSKKKRPTNKLFGAEFLMSQGSYQLCNRIPFYKQDDHLLLEGDSLNETKILMRSNITRLTCVDERENCLIQVIKPTALFNDDEKKMISIREPLHSTNLSNVVTPPMLDLYRDFNDSTKHFDSEEFSGVSHRFTPLRVLSLRRDGTTTEVNQNLFDTENRISGCKRKGLYNGHSPSFESLGLNNEFEHIAPTCFANPSEVESGTNLISEAIPDYSRNLDEHFSRVDSSLVI